MRNNSVIDFASCSTSLSSKVPWSSIGGMDSVKEELREAIELPEVHRELFERLRIPPPRGILLYGPPGTNSPT